MSDPFEKENNAVAAWFIGPRAENERFFKEFCQIILSKQQEGRKQYFQNDPIFITKEMQESIEFKSIMEKLKDELNSLMEALEIKTVPFWSPRYMAHMSMEPTLASNLGYMGALQYNQNNVTVEASPLTTYIEILVGKQLCEMLGFNTTNIENELSWGHITCDGSVANLESIWAARNLKYYPLSLRLAIEEGRLSFIGPLFKIELANGSEKLIKDCTTWELLNLKPTTVLDIPKQLYQNYGMTPQFLQTALYNYTIQTVGKDYLEEKFGITKPPLYLVSSSRHYSWPKGCAIVGIGSGNLKLIPVDNDARLDINHLNKILSKCVQNKQAVYAVTAIMGSTDHGACDPLANIIALRERYQRKYGLSFVIHADAAWGGYFRSMLIPPPVGKLSMGRLENHEDDRDTLVPMLALNSYTRKHLDSLKYCDSITIDPHKSGYIPYPGGGLCYRDQRMKSLVTWLAPEIFRPGEESISMYGVEGSKPGASPVAAYLSHSIIGLHQKGYGLLLGQANFSCSKIYCHWATMSADDDNFIVVPFCMLPTERLHPPNPDKVREQKRKIRELIVTKPNIDIINNQDSLELIRQIGPDLTINIFACNFKINNQMNEDVEEANYLNLRLFEKFSFTTKEQDNKEKPLIITSTILEQKDYGSCLTNFKKRLGLKGNQDLRVLINVVMNPWPTEHNFITKLTNNFKETLKDMVSIMTIRNTISPDHGFLIPYPEKAYIFTKHAFIMQGFNEIYLTHLPMFNLETHRYQVIMKVMFPENIMRKYMELRKQNPSKVQILYNQDKITIDQIVKEGASFKAFIATGFDPYEALKSSPIPLISNIRVITIKLLKKRHLRSSFHDKNYPIDRVPFYIYGKERLHIDHLLLKSPSIQLSADNIQLTLSSGDFTSEQREKGVIAHIIDFHEIVMQPFPETKLLGSSFFFKPNHHYHVELYDDPVMNPTHNGPGLDNIDSDLPFATGSIKLPSNEEGSLFVDSYLINEDPTAEIDIQNCEIVNRPTKSKEFYKDKFVVNSDKNWYEISSLEQNFEML